MRRLIAQHPTFVGEAGGCRKVAGSGGLPLSIVAIVEGLNSIVALLFSPATKRRLGVEPETKEW